MIIKVGLEKFFQEEGRVGGGERKAEVERCESRLLRGHGSDHRNKHEPLNLRMCKLHVHGYSINLEM